MVEFINLAVNEKDIIYDDKVKTTYNGQGLIRLKNDLLGKRAYVIFPIHRRSIEQGTLVAVDEILNKGIHPHNDHTTRILLGREYVGRKCIVILQEG